MNSIKQTVGKNIITPEFHNKIRKSLSHTGDTLKIKSDAVIIGSGAGGGVAAYELSRAGWNVVVLEEGPYKIPDDYGTDEFQALNTLYRESGFISEEDFNVHILQGRVVGGSTVVNWQTCLYPERFATDIWEKEFGLKGFDQLSMAPYIKEVESKIGIARVPDRLINRNNEVLQQGAKKIGVPYVVNKNNNRRSCMGLGRCGMGCPIGAKQSVDLTYLADAVKLGAQVYSSMRAEHIEDGKLKKVTARYIVDPGQEEKPGAFSEIQIESRVVIVSAGALESPVILQRSGLGNSFVGKHLKLHPTVSVFGRFNFDIENYYGPPQSIVVKEFTNLNKKGYGYFLEVAPHGPVVTSLLMPFFGETLFEAMEDYKKICSGLVLVKDGADGGCNSHIEYSGGKRKVYYELSETDKNHMLEGIWMFSRILVSAGATQLILPFKKLQKPIDVNETTDLSWIKKETIPSSEIFTGSAHPHGSVQAADSESRGALNQDMELYGHENIFVMDGSWPPASIGVNPMVLIQSTVMRAARKLAGQKERLNNA